MKVTKFLSIVLFVFIASVTSSSAASSFKQVRNSLWVFGVDNSSTTEVEMVEQGITQFAEQIEESKEESAEVASQQELEVPEELDLAIAKFES
ncbi:putative exported protein [Halobacteriovorax marinus SJ]|uniref:Exported protein n=1 Tax=Halobacteriovorax marinus (strain ATCC BAA-682 / DSM 15412 / SJ) TaxID=862908 RepID=E1WYP0_HALMS|nr:hypothetical protein [Halobacteriovorax marinus]CBW27680.1 putative exported protein [Halobacteriovorax marinus SJ]